MTHSTVNCNDGQCGLVGLLHSGSEFWLILYLGIACGVIRISFTLAGRISSGFSTCQWSWLGSLGHLCRVAAGWLWGKVVDWVWYFLFSHVLPLLISLNPRCKDQRKAAKDSLRTKAPPMGERRHQHALSANARARAYCMVKKFADVLDLIPRIVQPAARDHAYFKDAQFLHAVHWPIDLVEPTAHPTGEWGFSMFVDVDHYINPHKWQDRLKPLVFLTFQPTAPARDAKDYLFQFNRDQTVTYRVTGDNYTHEVWNYVGTHLLLRTWFKVTYYALEKFHYDEDHAIVFLVPMWTGGFWASLLSRFMPTVALSRYEPYVGGDPGFYRMLVESDEATRMITGVDFNGSCGHQIACVTPEVDHAVALHVRSFPKLGYPTELTKITGAKLGENYVLNLFHRQSLGPGMTTMRYDVGPLQYQVSDTWDPTAKPTGQPIGPVACFVPEKCQANSENSIASRIQAGVKRSAEAPDPGRGDKYAKEFVMAVAERVGSLKPFTLAEVAARMDKPKHKNQMASTILTGTDNIKASTFVKAEAYSEAKDCRPIINLGPDFKFDWSAYTLPLADALHAFSWYAFGLTPKEVAQRVAEVARYACKHRLHVMETDFSRFDGSVSNLRKYERLLLTKVFGPQAVMIWSKQIGATVHFGDSAYTTGGERLSGSPETSVLNTFDNALFNYVALREAGVSPAKAFAQLGIYGGDDGLTVCMKPESFVELATAWGMRIKPNMRTRGERMSFLGRIYGGAWSGDPNSCSDLNRVRVNLSFTSDAQADPAEKMREKLRSLRVTDPNTPILKSLYEGLDDGPMSGDSYWAQKCLDTNEPFYNTDADWMRAYCNEVCPEGLNACAAAPRAELPCLVEGMPMGSDCNPSPPFAGKSTLNRRLTIKRVEHPARS